MQLMKNKLDFIVVGAQKSGTTTIASWLQNNNDVFIPNEKELPFFLKDDLNKKGVKSFIEEYFYQAKKHQLIGTSTPQYMMYDYSFKEIKKIMPDIKLIAVLRDPVDRLLSHYDMAKRFGLENRNINLIINDQLNNIEYYRSLKFGNGIENYIVSGEYHRIIEVMKKSFSEDQILLLKFSEIKSNPLKVNLKICNFLNVKSSDIKKTHSMQGGSKSYFNHNKYINYISKISNLNKILPSIIKKKLRLAIYKMDQINVKHNSKSSILDISLENLESLKNHYKDTYKLIKSL